MIKKTSTVGLLLVVIAVAIAAKQPPRNYFGLRIGRMKKRAQRLRQIARQDKEEREKEGGGEQEVWLFNGRSKYKYVLAKFNNDR